MSCTTTRPPNVLVVDDEKEIRSLICRLLKQEGFKPVEADSGKAAMRLMQQTFPDLVLLDVTMPDSDGMNVLQELKKFDSVTPVILLTGCGSIGAAVEAIKSGAYHYLTKPFSNQELLFTLRGALAQRRDCRLAESLPRASTAEQPSLQEMMGSSDSVHQLISDIDRVAPTDFTVIISGETGSGKELVAREIYLRSRRVAGPFVTIDCGAVQPSLIESELFGHEKGAYTGADRERVGKFVAASGGTLFLDEVQNLPLAIQANLLRALQERQVCPAGGSRYVNFDIRVIAATNQDLPVLVAAGAFRQDLFHRLNEFSIDVPPLRERADDIEYLARRFVRLTCHELGKDGLEISAEAIEALTHCRWPGNVRELRNLIRRAVLLADARLGVEHLGPAAGAAFQSLPCARQIPGPEEMSTSPMPLKELVRRSVIKAEREILTQVLKQTGGNKAEAARLLQVDYKTLRTKARQYSISISVN